MTVTVTRARAVRSCHASHCQVATQALVKFMLFAAGLWQPRDASERHRRIQSAFESPRRTGRLGPLRLSRTVTVTGRVTRTRAQAAAAGGTVRLKKKPAEGRPYTRPAGAARPRHST